MITDLTNAMLHTWREPLLAAGVHLKPPLYALKISGSRDQDRKVNFLIFSEEATSPACVAKLNRSYAGTERLREEFERQQALYAILPDRMPRPIGLFNLFGEDVLLEHPVPGQSLKSLLKQGKHTRPHEVEADLQQALDWLVCFQKQTISGSIKLSEAIQLPPNSPRHYADTLAEYGDISIPLVASHGDFWAGNLFFDQDQLHVIDWEDFACDMLPTFDALYFIITYTVAFPWRRWGRKLSRLEGFRRGFLQQNWLSTTVHETITAYLNKLDLPSAILPLLFIHFLNEMVVGKTHCQARRGLQDRWQQYLEVYLKG